MSLTCHCPGRAPGDTVSMAAPSGWCHLHGLCTGASKAVQWQRISILRGENTVLNPAGNQRTETHSWKQKTRSLTAEASAKSLLQDWLSPMGFSSSFLAVGRWGALAGRHGRRMGSAALADK